MHNCDFYNYELYDTFALHIDGLIVNVVVEVAGVAEDDVFDEFVFLVHLGRRTTALIAVKHRNLSNAKMSGSGRI